MQFSKTKLSVLNPINSLQSNHDYKWCSKCPPSARSPESDSLVIHCSKDDFVIKFAPLLDQSLNQVIEVMDQCTVDALLQPAPDGIVDGVKIGTLWWPLQR